MPILAYIFFLFKFILASIKKNTYKSKKVDANGFYVAKQKK